MKAFLSGVVLAILASYLYPEVGVKGGPVHSELFIKKIGVGVIFFCSGMKLDPAQVRAAGLNWRAHLFCQVYTFAFTPVAMYLVVSALRPLLENALADSAFVFDAVKTLACLPPPVSSAVILTAIAKGDEAVAIFNSSVGSFMGIFLTPLLVTLLVTGSPSAAPSAAAAATVPLDATAAQGGLGMDQGPADPAAVAASAAGTGGVEAGVSALEMAFELSLTVLAPLLLGQLVKCGLKLGRPPSWIGNFVLVLIIWASFCELWVSDITVTLRGLGFVLACVVGLQACGLCLVWVLATRVLKFDSRVSSALLFACTHKSLTLGMPLIDVLFPLTASATAIPILMCHPLQILGGGCIASGLAKRNEAVGGGARSPRAVAYQAVHDATGDVELAAYGDEEAGYGTADSESSDGPGGDDFDGTEVGGLFPREYEDDDKSAGSPSGSSRQAY